MRDKKLDHINKEIPVANWGNQEQQWVNGGEKLSGERLNIKVESKAQVAHLHAFLDDFVPDVDDGCINADVIENEDD